MLGLASCLYWMFAAADPGAAPLIDFGAETLPEFVVLHDTSVERVPHRGGFAHRVHFEKVDWPNIFFQAPGAGWDWSNYAGVAVSLFNPESHPVDVAMRVDNAGADGMNHCNTALAAAPPGECYVLWLYFSTALGDRFWGMRGVPERGPLGTGPRLDLSKITAFQVFLPRPQEAHSLVLEKAWLFGVGTTEAVRMPFIDRFGQYLHASWPGKLVDETEFAARRESEDLALAAAPSLTDRDAYGGWLAGPQREATGWFRTEQIDGKWWLITPGGRLFFSIGMDCVVTRSQTFVEGRHEWFSWLPGEEETAFRRFYSDVSGAHSMADIIGGKGRAFNFYQANLRRKFGEEWSEQWRNRAYRRLSAWGFNTIGNWSQTDVLEYSPLPYVVSTGLSGVLPVAGSEGYWAKMMDVYDPSFEAAVRKAVSPLAAAHAENPRCIGFFVDNELSWEGVTRGALNSPADQPCRRALLEQLRNTYGSVDALNRAWKTDFADWDALCPLEKPNDAANADLDRFLHDFARRYFETVNAAIKEAAPHHLYLGCRFASAPDPAVRACAEVADVVCFNLYYRAVPADRWVGKGGLGKPIIIGEFHFGALDRGMFHQGLVPTRDQHDRAASYIRYVQSVADHPAFVGCHWFQYVDEPVTGRWFDGENYNIGFVDVTDTPYPELVDAAKRVHADLYRRRYEAPKNVYSAAR